MSVSILEGSEGGVPDAETRAVLYCNTSDTAFGPLFDDYHDAARFLRWVPDDPRRYTDDELETKYAAYRTQHPGRDDV